MTDPTSTETIIKALRILARDIQSDDGVANGAIMQAAERLEEQAKEIEALKRRIELMFGYIPDRHHCEFRQMIDEVVA